VAIDEATGAWRSHATAGYSANALQPHDRDGHHDAGPVPAYVEREFRRYLECGILAHGFARARCGQCGHDFLITFSCKGRGVCPACNTRRMVETAAHLADHVLPDLPLRQWVLAVPKRLRYFLERDAELQGAALHLFLREVEQCLRAHSPGAGPAARLGAVAFIHRFGSTLNPHLHFHCVVIDGVFDAAAAGGVIFRAATGVGAPAIAAVQQRVRRQLLRLFVRRGLLPADDARAMAQWQHGGGFSVDVSVRIAAADRAGRERLLRYCARPPAPNPEPTAEPAHRRAARYAWARLRARIDEVFPLVCSHCGGVMRIIAFITDGPTMRDILVHLGEPTAPPRIAPARGPPLVGPARCRARHLRPPARTGVRIRSTHHWVTPSVHRQPSAPPGRRMPAAAGHATRAR
jgi:hypothetical protein